MISREALSGRTSGGDRQEVRHHIPETLKKIFCAIVDCVFAFPFVNVLLFGEPRSRWRPLDDDTGAPQILNDLYYALVTRALVYYYHPL
jgi:hypothetical protein